MNKNYQKIQTWKAVHSCDSFHLKMELSRSVQKVRIRIMNHHRIQKKEAKPVC